MIRRAISRRPVRPVASCTTACAPVSFAAAETSLRRPARSSARLHHAVALLIALLLALCCRPAVAQRLGTAPEGHSGWSEKGLVTSRHFMVVAANRLAAEAGREILRAGGSASDAAVAAQLVLGLVEPQSSGLGGGTFVVHWSAARREMHTYDGRETAPAAATPDRFLRNGKPLAFNDAVRSGLAVGVPGTVALLEMIHKRHGRLAWSQLFEPARRLAEEGFPVPARLAALLQQDQASRFSKEARAYFFDGAGRPRAAGSMLTNPAYAETLRQIAAHGARAFYEGSIAAAIVAAVRGAERYPGDMTLEDLGRYSARERPPVCAAYRRQQVCGIGPPSSGTTTVGQALMLLEGFDIGHGPAHAMNPAALHLIGESGKLAFADRNWYTADPDAVPQPTGLLDPDYIRARRELIRPYAPNPAPYPGRPLGTGTAMNGTDETVEAAGTSHVSIVDADGNAVAMTTTIEAGFGSGLWANGFLLNNEMTDFSFRPKDREGRPIANAVAPGKRPRSSMTPTLILDERGNLSAVLGSPGGSRIIWYVLKTVIALSDWKLDAQAATALPNFGARGPTFELERPSASVLLTMPAEWRQTPQRAIGLHALGHDITLDDMTSGTHVIVRRPDGGLDGGADPRREGVAVGD